MQDVIRHVSCGIEPRRFKLLGLTSLQEFIGVLELAVVYTINLVGEKVVDLVCDLIPRPIVVDRQHDLVEGV